MKFIFSCILTTLITTSAIGQFWEITSPIRVFNMIETYDNGIIISGYNFGNENNVAKISSDGNTLWEKSLFKNYTLVCAEVNDGFLGSSFDKLNSSKENRCFFKMNKNGDSLYSLKGINYFKIKSLKGNSVLMYDDSVVKYDHIKRYFEWHKYFGKIYDIVEEDNQYHLLVVDNKKLFALHIDQDGNVLQNAPIAVITSEDFEARFYQKGIFVLSFDMNNNHASYVSLEGDTIWEDRFYGERFYGELPTINIQDESIYIGGYYTERYDMYFRYNIEGKVLWKHSCDTPSRSLITQAYDGSVIVSCSSYVNKNMIYQYTALQKLDGSNNVTGIKEGNHHPNIMETNITIESISTSRNIQVNIKRTNTIPLRFEMYDVLGRLCVEKLIVGDNISLAGLTDGIYYYHLLQNEKILSRGKFSQ